MGQQWNQRENQKIPWGKWKWKHKFPKCMRTSQWSSKREAHSNTGVPQETRKISNKQPNLQPKIIRKRRTNKTRSQQKEGNNKDQRGINKIKIKKKQQKRTMKPRAVF